MAGRTCSKGKLLVLLSAVGLAVCRADVLLAGAFSVWPVQVVLSGSRTTALVKVVNEGSETARLQVTAHAWDQAPDGEIRLTPTGDLAFFPALFELAPGKERNVRIGVIVKPGAVEKTYRVFFEELPGAPTEQTGAAVRMMLRMSVPVFVEPAAPRRTAVIDGVELRAGELSWAVRNTGNARFVLQSVSVAGLDEAARPVFERRLEGWYVLAGGERVYRSALAPEECRPARSVRITATTDLGTVETTAELPPQGCATATP
jgi:fimbrial chaperone protein